MLSFHLGGLGLLLGRFIAVFSRAYRWQKVLDHIIFPVADLSVALDLLGLVVIVVYVESRVVREIPECHLIETFKEHVVCRRLVGDVTALVSRAGVLSDVGFLL